MRGDEPAPRAMKMWSRTRQGDSKRVKIQSEDDEEKSEARVRIDARATGTRGGDHACQTVLRTLHVRAPVLLLESGSGGGRRLGPEASIYSMTSVHTILRVVPSTKDHLSAEWQPRSRDVRRTEG